jgi:hypothetical protein
VRTVTKREKLNEKNFFLFFFPPFFSSVFSFELTAFSCLLRRPAQSRTDARQVEKETPGEPQREKKEKKKKKLFFLIIEKNPHFFAHSAR